VGLTFETDARDLARAVLDGVAYEIVMLIRRVADTATTPRRMVAVGGGSRSRGWMQIVADATSIPIDSTGSVHVAAYGAARLAARSSTAEDASQDLPSIPIRFAVEPRAAWRHRHVERLEEFQRTQTALREAR
jgi:xylulokinase